MDPLSVGRSCYRQKDYEGALAAFSEGIKISNGHILMTALDHRAATFEKLNQLQPALKDAKEMIAMKPELAKGYLRCAKILQLKGEETLALKIYERGLRKVKVGGDPDRPMLQEMFNKLQQKQCPTKTFDPMVMLPPELAQLVCEYLEMRDRVVCLAVSKAWKRFLEASHDLWTVLDLRSARRYIRLESLKANLRRSNYRLETAILTANPVIFNGSNIEVLSRLSPKLNRLEISYAGYFGDSLLAALPNTRNLRVLKISGAKMSLFSVVKALSLCPQLQRAEINAVMLPQTNPGITWPQLNSLTSLRLEFQGDRLATTLNLDQIISCTPNLQCASLIHQDSIFGPRNMYEFADFSMWSKLQHLEVTHAFFTTLAWLPPTLKHLYVTESHVSGFSAENEDLSPLGLPLLETYMCGAMDLSLEMIMAVITSSVKAGNLKALHMVNYHPNRTTLWAQPTLANDLLMPSVQELSLSKCDMHEDNIVKFLRLFPNLQTLDLSLTKITGVAVKEVMTREIGPLKWLGLNGCTKLSADAVEWARSLGTVVEYSNNPVKKPAGQRLWRDRLA